MESLFIADDERSIREGLKYILDWNELGFSLCGEAGTSEDTLKGLVTLNPSLALLDVRMPKMTGTEILKRARAMGFTGKCIIISGYSDFTYAKEALENGVSFYITKPVDEEDLLNSVKKIKEEIEIERAKSKNLATYKNKAKEVILKELLSGELKGTLSNEDLDLLQLNQEVFTVAIWEKFKDTVNSPYSLAELLRTSKANSNCIEEISMGEYKVVILKGQQGLNRLNNILEHYDDEPEEGSFLASLFITYGRPVDDIHKIYESFNDAKALMGRHFFCPMEQHYMGYDELPKDNVLLNDSLDSTKLQEFADKLKNYIQSYNHNEVADTLQNIKDYLVESTGSINSIKMFLTDLYWLVKENMIRVYPNESIPFPSASMVIQFFNEANYLYEIIRYLSEQCSMIMSATGSPNRDTILDDILYYIDHNYTGNIKLESIAPLFGYNSAYLGKIFSKAVGENFNSYIDHKRIDASKKLLENENLKVYEISEQVGYKNVDYFHKKFKKYVGVSPQEYRKNFNID